MIIDKKRRIWNIVIYAIMAVTVFIYLFPLIWIGIASLKTNKEFLDMPFGLPEIPQWENYVYSWTNGKLGTALLNSVKVCGVTLLLSTIIGSMAAFALGKMRFKLSGAMLVYFMTGMMIPVHCVLIPMFIIFAKIGLTNSTWSLIIPYTTFSLPITIFIMTGFFKGLPNEIFESATIDGCSVFRIFWRLAIPLSQTGLAVTCMMTFVNNWNELLMAMVFISDPLKKTLPVSLTYFVGPYEVNYVKMFAAIFIAVLPTIIVYSAFSNQIVEGLTQGAVKG